MESQTAVLVFILKILKMILYFLISVYDILTGNIVKTVPAHADLVRDASWHPTRPEILTSSWDTTVGLCTYSELITKQKRSPRVRLDDIFSDPQRPLRRSERIAQRRRANMEN